MRNILSIIGSLGGCNNTTGLLGNLIQFNLLLQSDGGWYLFSISHSGLPFILVLIVTLSSQLA